MDMLWMQNFLWLPQCDARATGSSTPLKTNRPLGLEDLEGDDDTRPDFTCPFCYEDFDIASLCSHLEDEHCYESKSAVCPICAVKVGNDLVGHITLHHGHLFKMQRRRKLRKAGTSTNSSLSSLEDVSKSSAASMEALANNSSSAHHYRPSLEASLTAEEREQKLEEETLQAKFVQQLVLSTIFRDS